MSRARGFPKRGLGQHVDHHRCEFHDYHVRDARGIFATGEHNDDDQSNHDKALNEISEEVLVNRILNDFEHLESIRQRTGRKELKTKHFHIKQVAELRKENQFIVYAITRDRALC